MGPIRRSRKRKSEPEPPAHQPAAEAEARGGKPVRFLLRASERLRTPPQPRPAAPQSQQVRGRRRQRVPRRVYRFLADLSSSDAHKPRHFPEEKVKQRNAVLLGQSSASPLIQPSVAGFGHFQYDPKLCPSSQLEVSSCPMIVMPSVPRTGDFQASLFGAFEQLRSPPQVPVLEIQSRIPDFDNAEGSKAFTNEMVCYNKRGRKVVEKSVREISRSVATSEEPTVTNTENDIGKEVPNDTTGSDVTYSIFSGPQESSVHEIIPNGMPVGIHELHRQYYIGALHGRTECTSASDNLGYADMFLSNSPTEYGNNANKADKCATSMEQDISEESFEQYLVMDDCSNDDLPPSIKSCQDVSHDHHPSEDNVAAIMEGETSCIVATENMSTMPLAMINDVANLLPSNVTSDMGKSDHQGLPGNTASIQQASADSPPSAILLPAFKGDTINTQSSTKDFAAEEQRGTSLEHHTLPVKESAAESSQSISKLAISQLFSTDIRNTTEAEYGNRLTMPEYVEGTMAMCVPSGTDKSYVPLLQRSLVAHESPVADGPSEPLAIENPPFLKMSPIWAHIEEMEIFKKVPQRPHFHPLKHLGPGLCEAMALGLMVFFSNTAESIKSLNIHDENELFKEKMKGLCLLEEYGFDVGHLRSRLETLLHIKNSSNELQDAIKKLDEKITLKEIDGKERGTQISMLYTAICQLERQAKLFRCILKSSVSQQKTDALEISKLKTEASDLEQTYLSVEQQFSSVVTEPW
ncbi:hypothetical protein PR202_ga10522 [Eleusine coracana subsp. coracana]|uniref:Uncharacterized protein n=1 Tax=Eleusine coracana subsp. coracana TaxID=191504 RepID=A0AAV5C723_ELECO|nr:hypothetical protein PR202_ga10522 [Eleusine coracana subsp. coracana]